jgi:DNA primase
MGILDEDVARVRDSADIVALVGEHLALKRVGARYRGLCPFHQEKTPSFYVNPELSVFHCFGCQASGDAITFVREMDRRPAARFGHHVAIRRQTHDPGPIAKTRLAETVGAAIDEYHRLLLDSPGAGLARNYLRNRGSTATPCAIRSGGRPTRGPPQHHAAEGTLQAKTRESGLGS